MTQPSLPESTPVFADAVAMIRDARSWEELRARLEKVGLLAQLSGDEMIALADAYRAIEAERLDPRDLALELAFWANGGTFESHLLGRRALPIKVLVAEAERRGWPVRHFSAGVFVTPPNGEMLRLSLAD